MMSNTFLGTLVSLLACTTFLRALPVGPTDMIRTSNEAMLKVLEDHPGDDQAIFQVLDRYTDFAVLSHQATAVLKDRMTPDQLSKLDHRFQELLRLSSIRKAGRYRATSFTYVREDIQGQDATVETLARYKEDEVTLSYQVRRRNDSWIIVNYIVDGVDTARNYQKQFLSLLNKKGAEGLISQIEKKVEHLRSEKS